VSAVVVFGGHGTFGRLVATSLVQRGLKVVIAGRDLGRAQAFAQSLDPPQIAQEADVRDFRSCLAAVRGQAVAVSCAGPFGSLGPALLDACLEARCPYADITDDRAYAALVRRRDEAFRERGLTAVYGCSSLPGLSGALGLLALEGASFVPERARVTLMIGNANPKGLAAIRSFVPVLGRPIAAPQGTLRGFRDREVVPLPRPFGPRSVYNFESPEYDLFPALFGVRSVVVKVGFELRLATSALATLAAIGSRYPPSIARPLEWLSRPFRSLGCSGGAVMTELFGADGSSRSAAISTPHDGQRMAALPCALVAHELTTGLNPGSRCGALTAYEYLGAQAMIMHMERAGFALEPRL
jgi:hypothetical protein